MESDPIDFLLIQPIISGPTGVGKTWIACALAHQVCREGYKALYLCLPRLFEELTLAHGDGRFPKLIWQPSLEPI